MFRAMFDAQERSSGASKRLSERYGIPEEEVKNLLYGKSAAAAANDPTSKPEGESSMPTAVEKNSRWSPISILGALLGVVGILSLVVVILILQRDRQPELPTALTRQMPPEAVQAPPPPPQAGMGMHHGPMMHMMQDSCCMAPDQKATSENEPTEETAPAPKKKTHKVTHRTPKSYTTTNSMEAEEHLAELRAEGNSKAKIHSSTKNGVTTYSVR